MTSRSEGNKEQHGSIWPDWYPALAQFRRSENGRAVWQIINSLLPYFFLWYLMIRTIQLGYPYGVTLVLILPASALLVRIFILFHDCVHNSFFASKRANTFFGYLFGVLVFTPFEGWRFSHLRHHVTYADLDTRGFGDIWTMTLQEYANSPKLKRLQYRLYRTPLILLGLGALFNFLLSNRLPKRQMKRKERMSILFTNLLILLVFMLAGQVIGWRTYLMIQLPVLWLAGMAGIWLFYVQHQFPGVYWARKTQWDHLRAAMEGSSYYRLPPVLRWFSGNIGYHHVHHLNPRIPNYQLKKCFESVPELQARAPLTGIRSIGCIRVKIWDEEHGKMVGFPH